MSWLDEAGTFVLALVVVFVPGAAAALLLRLRGFAVLAAAAPFSLAMLGAAAVAQIVVPFRWSPVAWGLGVALLLAIAVAVRWASDAHAARHGRPERSAVRVERGWREAVPYAVVAVVGALSAARLMSAFGAPSNISQTFDNIYHLNAVRHIMDDGVIAPTRQLLPGFYPDLWHIVVSTVARMAGSGVAETVNVVSIVLAALVWPIACVWLVRTIGGARVGGAIAAGALAIGCAAFPLLMLDFGVLYPNVLSISLLPSAIAAVVLVSGIGEGARPDGAVRWSLVGALVPTIALAHPSTLMALMLPAFLIVATGFRRWWSRQVSEGHAPLGRRAALGGLIALLSMSAVLFVVARPDRGLAFWPPSASAADAVAQVVSGGLVWRPAAWAVSVAALLGAVVILVSRRHRAQWWLPVSMMVMAALYVVCLSLSLPAPRYWLTGTWYQDIYRIAALLPAFLVPLGAMAVIGLSEAVEGLLRRRGAHEGARTSPIRRPSPIRWAAPTVGAAAGVLLLLVTQTGEALGVETRNTAGAYRQDARSPLLTDDERALIARLPELVPEDEVIVGNPWTGTSLSYALADRAALVPHIFQRLTPDMTVITEHLTDAVQDPRMCAALERTRTRWILDFGTAEIHNGDHAYPGLRDPGRVAGIVDREGDAVLYRIDACG